MDRLREVFQTIRKNKLRTVLSGFTITFAILLFTILFGMGNGLKNTFSSSFGDNAQNAIYIFPGVTTEPYRGLQSGRLIIMENQDLEFVVDNFGDKIEYSSAVVNKKVLATYKKSVAEYSVRAVTPKEINIEIVFIDKGRYINDIDIKEKTKNIVIGRLVSQDLFGNVNPIGKYLNLNDIMFKVVGVFSSNGGDNDERVIYMPITTAQTIYGNNEDIDRINLTYNPKMNYEEAISFGDELKVVLRDRFNIAPKDQAALSIRNFAETAKQTNQTLAALKFLVVFIGIGTLIAGVVGISNIMVYIVRERTKEFGVRKALGATPRSIIYLVLTESLMITALSGYLGLITGMIILKLSTKPLEKYFIQDPYVDNSTVIGATVLLIISGIIAGYLPAKRASEIKPIVALSDK